MFWENTCPFVLETKKRETDSLSCQNTSRHSLSLWLRRTRSHEKIQIQWHTSVDTRFRKGSRSCEIRVEIKCYGHYIRRVPRRIFRSNFVRKCGSLVLQEGQRSSVLVFFSKVLKLGRDFTYRTVYLELFRIF